MSLQGEPWSQTGRIPHARTKVVFKKKKRTERDRPQSLLLLPLPLLLFLLFSALKF